MGSDKTPHKLGGDSALNGYDNLYGPSHWRDRLVNSGHKKGYAKRFVMYASFDIIALVYLLGFVDNLNNAKAIILLVISIGYVAARLIVTILKGVAWVGSNKQRIKNGWQSIKDIIKE